jgi:16S rRNA (cytosine967-C5)-methyltransferase
VEALGRAVGAEHVRAYLTEGGSAPPLGLCVAPEERREDVIARLRAAAPKAEIAAGAVSPLAVVVRGAGDLRRLPGIGQAFIAQEEGAQVIALALGAGAGERVLDACAGHGNKTWVLAQQVGARGEVAAADLYPQKLRQIDVPAGRAQVKTFAVDWSLGRGEVPGGFDRVLVDAPCSGTGTLRRRPEILGKRTAADLPRLAALQAAIVRGAAACVHHGGRLVYAVCSVLREEAEGVVEAVTRDAGGVRLVPAPFDAPAIRGLFGEVTAFRLLPHVHGTDGYFAASFVVERA